MIPETSPWDLANILTQSLKNVQLLDENKNWKILKRGKLQTFNLLVGYPESSEQKYDRSLWN